MSSWSRFSNSRPLGRRVAIAATIPAQQSKPTKWLQKRGWAASTGADGVAFAVGLASCYTIRLVGEIPASEPILFLFIPILLIFRMDRIIERRLRLVFVFLGLWLLCQILTDIYRSTAMVDWLRGDANIVFFGLDILGLAALLRQNERRQVIFLLGYAIGILLGARFFPSLLAQGDPWKFGYSGGVMLLVVLGSGFFFKRRQYAIVGLLFAGMCGLNILFDYRSPVLTFMITAVLILPVVPEQIGRIRLLPRAGTAKRAATLAGLAIGVGFLAGFIMTSLAAAGVLGPDAQSKNENQSSVKWGILIGGRPEILVSSVAVMDSPILGHGSWASDTKYVDLLITYEVDYGMERPLNEESYQGLIPAHSHLMGAWVNSGILGAVFWVYVLILDIKAISRAANLRTLLTPTYIWLLVSFAWAILFSPLGSTNRLPEAFNVVVICDLLSFQVPALSRASRLPPASRRFPLVR